MITQSKFDLPKLLHTLVGISLMLFGRYIPPPSMVVAPSAELTHLGFPSIEGGTLISLSSIGVTVISIFIGVIYLWTFVDLLWPCFMGILLLGFSSYGKMTAVLNQFFGNPMIMLVFFLFMFAAVIVRSNVAAYIARWLLTRPIIQGRPWLLTTMILFTCYLVGFFEAITALFLMWPVIYVVFKEAGYKKGDKYVTLLLVNSVIMIMLCFASDPIKGGAFYLLSSLYTLADQSKDLVVAPINFGAFFIFGVTLSLTCLLVIILMMRYVFQIDVSRLKNLDINLFQKDDLPPMNWEQKAILLLFAIYAMWLLLPGFIGTENILGAFLKENLFGASLFIVTLVSFIHWNGEPVADIGETNKEYPWRVYLLFSVAVLLGSAMMSPQTNFTVFMKYGLKESLAGLGYVHFIIAVIVFAIVATNFCNSIVTGLIVAPVIVAICNAFGFESHPVLACFFFTVLIGAVTPAASPFAAILYDNKEWLETKEAMLYATISSAVVVAVVITVGIPLSKICF